MKPTFGRHDNRARLPIHSGHLFAFRPQQGIVFSGENKYMRPWTMTMGLFVNADGKTRNVRTHHAFRHLEEDRRIALAALGPCHRFDIDRVGYEIGFDDPVAVERAFAAKKPLFAFEP